MSIRRRLLNAWLRAVEKPRIRRAAHPAPLRRALELQAKLFFHAPFGMQKLWIRLGAIDAFEVRPRNAGRAQKVIFYIHGGGFTFGSPRTHAALAAQVAHRTAARAILPKYRLAPEHPYPAAPDDVRAAWEGLLSQGVLPKDIIIGGDSAGGALAFGLLADLIRLQQDLPAGVFGFSPLTDLTHSGQSFQGNAHADVVLPAEKAAVLSELFLQGQRCDDPRVSPLLGDFRGACPIWVTAGDTEILLDDARRLAARCEAQGVETTLIEAHDLPHVWPIFHNILPEGRQSLDQLADWIKRLPGWQGES